MAQISFCLSIAMEKSTKLLQLMLMRMERFVLKTNLVSAKIPRQSLTLKLNYRHLTRSLQTIPRQSMRLKLNYQHLTSSLLKKIRNNLHLMKRSSVKRNYQKPKMLLILKTGEFLN